MPTTDQTEEGKYSPSAPFKQIIMPISERIVEQRFAYSGQFLEDGGNSSTIQDVQMGSMYGTLVQLGYLAQYAHQIFDGLVSEAKVSEARLNVVKDRTKVLMSVLKTHSSASLAAASLLPVAEQLVPETMMSGFFTRESQPASISQRYTAAEVGSMPDFSRIDAVLLKENDESSAGMSSCSKNYSYPDFFVHEWMRAEEERIQKLQEEKRQRRAEKRARKQQLKDGRESSKQSAVMVKNLDWKKKYENNVDLMPTIDSTKVTGNVKELVKRQERPASTLINQGGRAGDSSINVVTPKEKQELPQRQLQTPVIHERPAPVIVTKEESDTIDSESESEGAGNGDSHHHHQPPTPPPERQQQQEQKRSDDRGSFSGPESEAGTGALPPKRGLNAALLADLNADLNAGSKLKDSSLPLPPTSSATNVEASPSNASPTKLGLTGGGGGRAMSPDLLASISKGKSLRSPTEDDRPRPTSNPKMSVLQDIKSNKARLKHIAEKTPTNKTPTGRRNAVPSLANEVAGILARRKFLQAQSIDDSDDEDEWKD